MTSTPDVARRALTAADRFLLLGSDGIWEFLSPEQAVSIVQSVADGGGSAFDACRLLVTKAALLWRVNEGLYRDDITAAVVYLDSALQQLGGGP